MPHTHGSDERNQMPLRPLRHWVVAAAALLIALSAPAEALAHPLGNFTVNHYSRIELRPGQARIFYVLDMAELPAFQTIQQIDTDRDGRMSSGETDAFIMAKVEALRAGIQLRLDGKTADLQPSSPELSFPPGQGGLSLLRLTFWLNTLLPGTRMDATVVEYRDANETGRIGWREIVVRAYDGIKILDSSVSDQDVSDELRNYPQDLLSSPLNQTSARIRFSGQTGGSQAPVQTSSTAVGPLGAATNDGAFAELITVPNLDLSVVALALVTAVALGALHALEPGHGKTAAAAYLVGSRATPRHAIVLGVTITAMHTSSVFVMGLVTLFASSFIVPERLLPWLGLASGLIVIGVGLRMFFSRLLSRSAHIAHSHAPGGEHNHAHHDEHEHMHDHAHDHGHDHSHHHDHSHSHDDLPSILTESKPTWRGVLAVGISGGLVPCPAALIVLLSAIGLGRIGFGLLLIVAFSAGLALVLSLIGLSVLYGERWLSRRRADARIAQLVPAAGRFVNLLPAFSGLMVVGAGMLLLYHALPFLRVWQP